MLRTHVQGNNIVDMFATEAGDDRYLDEEQVSELVPTRFPAHRLRRVARSQELGSACAPLNRHRSIKTRTAISSTDTICAP